MLDPLLTSISPNPYTVYTPVVVGSATPTSYVGADGGVYSTGLPGSYATSVPTAYSAVPAAAQGQASLASQMIDAIASALVPEEAPVTYAPAPVAAPAAAMYDIGMLPAAMPVAPAATVNVGYGTVAAPMAAVASVYEQGSIVAPVKKLAGRARRKGSELWAGIRDPRSVHVTQVPSKYNRAPAAGNRDCGPASVVMALKLVGLKIPGIVQTAPAQRLINRVRALAGAVASSVSTTNFDLERALGRAGATTRELTDAGSLHAAVLAGRPVILNGNPRNAGAYGPSFTPAQMTPFNGQHWVVVSGFDSRSGKYIINDPLSKIGPVKVTEAQLEAYRAGSMGIEVSR